MSSKSKINNVSLILSLLALTIALFGCGRKEQEKYGQKISNYAATDIGEILKNAEDFNGKTVTVQGEISRECPAGCWFNLKESSAEIYVDLNPSAFAIPQKVGKNVTVEGKVSISNNQTMIVGTGVEIK